jgi:hypothetical protein
MEVFRLSGKIKDLMEQYVYENVNKEGVVLYGALE